MLKHIYIVWENFIPPSILLS